VHCLKGPAVDCTHVGCPSVPAFCGHTGAAQVYAEEMRLPYPWDKTAKVAVVRLDNDLRVCLANFHEVVLCEGGPMEMNFDTLRARLNRVPNNRQLLVSQASHPRVLSQLKENNVVGPRCARTKLVDITELQAALISSGQRRDHVAAILRLYLSIVPSSSNALRQSATTAPANSDQGTSSRGTGSGEAPSAPVHVEEPTSLQHTETTETPSESRPLPQPESTDSMLRRLLQAISTKRKPAEDDLHTMQRDWPSTLPELVFPPSALKSDYSLKVLLPDYKDDSGIPLGQELDDYRAWCVEPVNLDRSSEYSAPVQPVTVTGALDCIHGFMGFMFKVRFQARSHYASAVG